MDWQEYNKNYPVKVINFLPKNYYHVCDDRYDAEKFIIFLLKDEDCYVKSVVVEFKNKFYVIPEKEIYND